MYPIRLIESAPLSPRALHLAFCAPFRHEAGQYVALHATVRGEPMTRYYSIASPPREDGLIEFCVDGAGRFGSLLGRLRAGDEVLCSEPAGTMRVLKAAGPSVYVATGTGVAPLRAILRAQFDADPRAEAALVQGARHVADLYYRDEFESLAQRHPGFRYLPTLTAGDREWRGRRGRVAACLDEAVAGRDGVTAYVCGHPEMVADVRRRLALAGVADDRQCFERY